MGSRAATSAALQDRTDPAVGPEAPSEAARQVLSEAEAEGLSARRPSPVLAAGFCAVVKAVGFQYGGAGLWGAADAVV